ncbi:MAG: tetraacyldisaccharide 4'-kinase [Armatimonadota bacterium]|nr:tetraacyldisaccharide 4'-kinase [Armatimonadota bacterium]
MSEEQLQWWQKMLLPFSVLYAAGLEVYLWWRLPRQFRAQAVVISVGNLSLGGTGKTPTVIAICRYLQRSGRKVGILSRGYGGTMSRAGGVVSDGQRVLATAAEAGDEPLLLARKLPGVAVLVGKDRRKTARRAVEQFGCEVLVLDDGFQYWQLHRDVDLVLLDGERPFGNGWTLPAGTLREPAIHLQRAHALLIQGGSAQSITQSFPLLPCFLWQKSPVSIRSLYHVHTCSPAHLLQGKRVFALAAIASFDSFPALLAQLGAQIAGTWSLPDHYRYTARDVTEAQQRARACRADAIVVTEKDAVKLEEMDSLPQEIPFWVLDIEAQFSQGFWRWLDAQIRTAEHAHAHQTV